MNIKERIHNMNTSRVSFKVSFVFIVVFFVLGLFLGGNLGLVSGQPIIRGIDPSDIVASGEVENTDEGIPEYLTKDVDFNLFWDVWNMLKADYYEENIPETQLFYGALSGLVSSLGDPHTVFFTPANTDEFHEGLNGKFEGIGAEIGIRNDVLTVIAPLDDSPALKAGLQPKDLILEIDSKKTKGLSLAESVSLIRGDKDTEVVLTVYREGFILPKDISITRGAIKVDSLSLEFKDDIAYVKIRQFNAQTVPLFNDAIREILQKPSVSDLILDLRYNPGGYLQAAIDVSGEWAGGEVVVKEILRGGKEELHRSGKKSRLSDFKTVVLVNGGSASGSEIVAGALQDLNKATILGAQTFGKGSVQKLNNLSNGSSVKITIAKWFTPNGNSIDGDGITPDIVVEMDEEDYNNYIDPQLDRAIEIINENN
jgi:carboxyl-terminal processing protease